VIVPDWQYQKHVPDWHSRRKPDVSEEQTAERGGMWAPLGARRSLPTRRTAVSGVGPHGSDEDIAHASALRNGRVGHRSGVGIERAQ
jgi:hypothetical protein